MSNVVNHKEIFISALYVSPEQVRHYFTNGHIKV